MLVPSPCSFHAAVLPILLLLFLSPPLTTAIALNNDSSIELVNAHLQQDFHVGQLSPPPHQDHQQHSSAPYDPLAAMATNEEVEALIEKKVPVPNTPLAAELESQPAGSATPPPAADAALASQAEGVIERLASAISARSGASLDAKSMYSLFQGGLEMTPDAVKRLQEGLAAKTKGGLTLQEIKNSRDLPRHVPLARGPASYFLMKEGDKSVGYVRIADGEPFIIFAPLQEPKTVLQTSSMEVESAGAEKKRKADEALLEKKEEGKGGEATTEKKTLASAEAPAPVQLTSSGPAKQNL